MGGPQKCGKNWRLKEKETICHSWKLVEEPSAFIFYVIDQSFQRIPETEIKIWEDKLDQLNLKIVFW